MTEETKKACFMAFDYAAKSGKCEDMQKAVGISMTALIECQYKNSERIKEVTAKLSSVSIDNTQLLSAIRENEEGLNNIATRVNNLERSRAAVENQKKGAIATLKLLKYVAAVLGGAGSGAAIHHIIQAL